MFNNDNTESDSNFWISYADLMAGLLFVFILLIGAIISKSSILKNQLHDKEDRLSHLSTNLEDKEKALDKITKSLEQSQSIIGQRNSSLSEHEKLLAQKDQLIILKNARIEQDKIKLAQNEKLLKVNINDIEKIRNLLKIATMNKEKLQKLLDIEKNQKQNITQKLQSTAQNKQQLEKLLSSASNRRNKLDNQLISLRTLLNTKKEELKQKNNQLYSNNKNAKNYQAQITSLSSQLKSSQKQVTFSNQQLLVLNHSVKDKESKYQHLLLNMRKQKEKIKSLTGMKLKVLTALKKALGNKINIDKKTGSLRLASNILFDRGTSALKPKAKVELKKAFERYIGALVRNRNIKPHLDKIIIEGHTDSDGGYIYNLNLSQKRALAVMEYLLTLRFTKQHNIKPLMIASGRAYLDAIKHKGKEDKSASRRIEIKFRLKNEDAMKEIEKVLDAK